MLRMGGTALGKGGVGQTLAFYPDALHEWDGGSPA